MVPGADARGLVAPRRAVRGNAVSDMQLRLTLIVERTTTSFNCITTFPDHGADGTAQHVCFDSTISMIALVVGQSDSVLGRISGQ